MTKTELTALQRERFFYVMGMASGFGAALPAKVFPMLAALSRAFDMEFEKITREHENVIQPWFENFLVILRSLSADEITAYAEHAEAWSRDNAGGSMFG